MFEYSKENLRRLQLVELEMLVELDRICRKYEIKYIIDAGTLLGAVRHEGFIPWDDDVDVRMLRADYDRFCDICRYELADKFFLQNHDTDPGFLWGYARILRNDSTYIRANHEEMKSKNGIFIDIFPNDTLPDNYIARCFYTSVTWMCHKILYSGIGAKHSERKIDKIGFGLLNIFPKEFAHKIYKLLIKMYRNSNSRLVRCYGWGSREETKGFQREWLDNITDIIFEGKVVRAPVHTKEFLIFSFGDDYMTPPPENQRVPGHLATHIDFPEDKEEHKYGGANRDIK